MQLLGRRAWVVNEGPGAGGISGSGTSKADFRVQVLGTVGIIEWIQVVRIGNECLFEWMHRCIALEHTTAGTRVHIRGEEMHCAGTVFQFKVTYKPQRTERS